MKKNQNWKSDVSISPIFKTLKIFPDSFANSENFFQHFYEINKSLMESETLEKKVSLEYFEEVSRYAQKITVSKPNHLLDLDVAKPKNDSNGRLTGYSKIQELKLVKIGLASSEKIAEWAEKILPNGKIFGEVLNANTLHYKTFKPHKGGLFCERIFGPLKDFECACGIKNKPFDENAYVQNLLDKNQMKKMFCPNCDVEYTWSVVRRYQLGYIQLASPVTHLWYFKTNPSYLALLLDLKKNDLESIIYCMQTTTLEYYWKPLHAFQMNITASSLFQSYQKFLEENSKAMKKKLLVKTNLIQFKTKKQKKLFQKRQKLNIYGKPPVQPPDKPIQVIDDTASLDAKISFLENSFKLKCEESLLNRRNQTAKVKFFLRKKETQIPRKDKFFEISKQVLKDFYKKRYLLLSKEKHTVFLKLNSWKNGFSRDFFSKNLDSGLRQIVYEGEAFLPRGSENSTKFRHLRSKLSGVLKPFLLKSSASAPPLTELRKPDKKKIILSDKFSRKSFLEAECFSETQNCWFSIYQDPKKTLHLLNIWEKKKRGDVFQPNDFEFRLWRVDPLVRQILENGLVLYFFFVLQEHHGFLNNSENIPRKEFFQSSKVLKKIYDQIQLKWSVSSFVYVGHQKNLKGSRFFLKLNDLSAKTKSFLDFFERANILKGQKLFYQILLNFALNNCTSLGLKLLSDQKFKANLRKSNEYVTSSIFRQNFKAFKLFPTEILNLEKKLFVLIKSFGYPTNYLFYSKTLSNLSKKLFSVKTERWIPFVKLFNNIYTVSYSTGWSIEKDWKYFLYYNTSPIEISDVLLRTYQYRFPGPELRLWGRSEARGLSNFFGNFAETPIPVIGSNLIQKLVLQYEGLELKRMAKQYQNLIPKLNRYIRSLIPESSKIGIASRNEINVPKKSHYLKVQKLLQKRDLIIRRLKLLRKLFKKNSKPNSMILKTLPVLPPDLRPILKMQNQIAASDLNRFYQRIIYRNERLKKFLKANSSMLYYETNFEIKYVQRLLQEAVDNLIQNGKGQVKPETNSRGQPLKSLSEILKGKQGRFRQYLLGKRVDYSGRSVIVVGPSLKIYQCGLPYEMAMELFLPFLMKRVFQYGLAKTVVGAKSILKTQKKITWNLLEEIMQSHPILLNRAPTLHRLGIQAFQPKLIEGRAILLHPLVCPAFNADFDGDQMAIHVPITVEARTEAWKLMFSRNHLISPATGEPMLLPSQDMVLGCYYLTTESLQSKRFHTGKPFLSGTHFYFSNMQQVLQAYFQDKIHLQTSIWIQWNGWVEMDQILSQPFELRIQKDGSLSEFRSKIQKFFNVKGACKLCFVRTTAGRVLWNALIEKSTETFT